jgi:hypothetical protein
MRRHWVFPVTSIALLTCFGLGGCGSDSGAPAAMDAATSEAATILQPVDSSAEAASTSPSGIVVVNSIYGDSTSISFLDRDGNLVQDGCFNSGTGATGTTPTLSGDVVLPTQVPPGGPVVLIDRDRGYNTLTWLDPTNCKMLRQLAVGTGFYSNPHDVVTLSASKAYVTRNSENGAATPDPNDFDDGDDLLIIDPTQRKILGRIDLKPLAPAGVLPCADRALLAEGTVFVSLNAISLDFATYGTGRIVMVDPVTDHVTGFIDLPGAKNCGAMTYLAAERKLMVACTGSYSDVQQTDTSAIVTLDLGVFPPAVVAQVAATSVGGRPFTNATLAALDGIAAFAVTFGDPSNVPPDRLWSLPIDGNLPVKVFDSNEAFSMGAVLADSRNSRVLVADGTGNSPAFLRFFDYSAGTFMAGKTVQSNPKKNLPPHALAFY